MTKRKGLSKKVRFEVFKRDSFKCQYCGKSSPDVVLQVDHIKPVSKGGDNDITNLVTSCLDCNNGKGARELDDDTAIAKQRAQLEELNQRREQLEMMLRWKDGLKEIENESLDAVIERWQDETAYRVNDNGRRSMARWLKKYGVSEILECIDLSTRQYLQIDDDGNYTHESAEKSFNYIPRIAACRARGEDTPEMRGLYYCRGVLRNRLHYVNERDCLSLLKDAMEAGADLDDLKMYCKRVRNWTAFRDGIYDFINTGELVA